MLYDLLRNITQDFHALSRLPIGRVKHTYTAEENVFVKLIIKTIKNVFPFPSFLILWFLYILYENVGILYTCIPYIV